MIKTDEEALICDLAETYRIYDYRQLPAYQVAVFSVGLREDSRIKQAMSGNQASLDTLLSAAILDRLTTLVWFKTSDGQKGRNRPESIAAKLTGSTKEEEREIMVFDSGEDFEKMRRILLGKNGGES
ncbi:DUF5361 domain-containing protein [Streptococcus sanguinis]|uniref:DUF5361 domain-containing protein n=1 Tax=Streptococcus sanguinis TaxID=1305 RepID=UPI000F6830C0|nr:DUF5361 domain-containing protein [Streptococcus sanguinis]RSI51574.1 hypothetical protein D8870_09780 [Streptococcus sanguinis]